jgi:hypothetical protein
LASVGVGVDVLVTVHEKVTTGKRGWHKVVGTGNVARKGCESVPTTKRVGVVVRTLELGKRAMVVMCLALLWILNLQKKICDQNETTAVCSKVQLARKMYALYILINDAGNIFWSTRSALILLLFFPGFFVPALIGKTKQMRCGDERYSPQQQQRNLMF